MPKKLQPIPKDQKGAIPYLSIRGAGAAIEFYKRAFGATELMRIGGPGGRVGHAEIKIGAARLPRRRRGATGDWQVHRGYLQPAKPDQLNLSLNSLSHCRGAVHVSVPD